MIQALIVDDEPMHIDGLVRHVQWEKLGYAQPYTAQSGEDALSVMREHAVDVLITDVSMPEMTGIELVAHCKADRAWLQVLMVSGYNEFEFVQEAIHVGAQGYVLKPIKIEEVESKLTAFRVTIEKLKQIESEATELQEKVSGSLDAVKERFAHELLVIGVVDEGMMNSWSRLLELPDVNQGLRLTVFAYDRFVEDRQDARSRVIRGSGFLKAVNVSLSDLPGVIVAKLDADEIVAIHLDPSPDDLARVEKQVGFIQQLMEQQYGSTVTVGFSRLCLNWEELPLVYKKVKFMMARARLLEGGQVLDEAHLDETEFMEFRLREEYIPRIVRLIEDSEVGGQALEYVGNVFDMLQAQHPFTYIQAFGLGLVSELARRSKRADESMNEIPVWQQLVDAHEAIQVREVVMAYIERQLERKRQPNHNLIQLIITYIEEHVHENVTVKQLAEKHHMNASYLSVLFKKVTGQTLSDFIQESRMKKAIQLLRDPHIRVYEVAEQVGFQTSAYFTYLFKKHTGYTPQEYRDYH